MIRINKSLTPPSILNGSQSKGALKTEALKQKYDANPALYHIKYSKKNHPHKLSIDNAVYGDKKVKEQLIKDQHEKCCFCESKFMPTSFGDVEHFRPKGGFQQHANSKLEFPGYYWLAYDWSNLLFSCEVCNRRYKKNRFPLPDASKRIRNHHGRLSDETPSLINPVVDNPEDHLTFNDEVIVPKNRSVRGKESIKAFGLDRLEERRHEHFRNIEYSVIWATIDLNNDTEVTSTAQKLRLDKQKLIGVVTHAKKVVAEAATQKGEYAGMIRAAFPHLPR